MITKLLLLLLVALVLVPASLHAACDAKGNVFGKLEAPIPGIKGDTVDSIACQDSPILSYVKVVITFITALIVILALIVVVLGGYRYMTAGGDASNVGKAKTMIGGALLGIILALTSFLILDTISKQFASDLKEPTFVKPGAAPAP